MDSSSALFEPPAIVSADKPRENGHLPNSSSARPRLALEPGMSLRAAARAVLAFQFDLVLAHEAGTLRGDDPEGLHEMRVATSRLRAALRDFSQAFDQEALKPLVQDVRWLAKILGRVRDIDVFLEWLKNYERTIPIAERRFVRKVIENLRTARVRERAVLIAGLNSPRYQGVKHNFRLLILDESAFHAGEDESPVELAESKIKRQLVRVRKLGKKADLDHLRRLHKLRIECKRLRYTSECFETLFDEFPKKLISESKEIQDSLGAAHDAEVHSHFLQEMQRTRSVDPTLQKALGKMIRALRREQHGRYKDSRRTYSEFRTKKFRRKIVKRLANIPT
jgi:CHAD domain-containing protein